MKVMRIIELILFSFSIVLSGCSSVTTHDENLTDNTAMTKVEYLASFPDDINLESRGRLPIVNRADLDDEGKAIYDRYTSPDSTSLAGLAGPGGLRLHSNVDKSPTRIDGKVRALIRLTMARELDQVFEWTLYEPVGLREGISPEVLDVIRYDQSLTGVPLKEASIVRLAREIFRNHHVSSDTYQLLKEQFGSKELMEIAYLVGDAMESYTLLFMFDVHLPYERKPLLPVK